MSNAAPANPAAAGGQAAQPQAQKMSKLQQLEGNLKEFHARMDALEKRLLPSPSARVKSEVHFLKTIKLYDSYQA